MSEARINRISNELGTGGPIVSGITTFSNVNYFVPPRGTTAERPSNCPPGSIRFNTDGAHLEYFDGLQWLEMEAFNNELGVSNNSAGTSGGLGHRGLFHSGYLPGSPATYVNTIEYLTISTLGNTIDFGDSSQQRSQSRGLASTTRGVFAGGVQPGATYNIIDYVTISSTGNALDFGDLFSGTNGQGEQRTGSSNSTRGLFNGGYTLRNSIDYITIASTGNAQDFGDLTVARWASQAVNSTTRSIVASGVNPGVSGEEIIIDYVTISSTGNASNFGDLSTDTNRTGRQGVCNATRGIFGGVNTLDFITMSSTGNAQDFGDLIVSLAEKSASSPTRGIFAGGFSSPAAVNAIEYVTISSTGNASDFGDLTTNAIQQGSCSNGHGGL